MEEQQSTPTSFLASDNGGGYRYAAYEDDYLYDNNHNNMNRSSSHNMVGMQQQQQHGRDGTQGNMNNYGGYDYMNMNLTVEDNLSSSAASSHTPSSTSSSSDYSIDFDDPAIANLPRILLMGPRRGGKTSIQRVVFQKMSPHETLLSLEATQDLERAVVDHTPLCRFTIWDFPGDQQQQHQHQQQQQHQHQHQHQHQQQQQFLHHHQYHPMGGMGGILPTSTETLHNNNNNNNNLHNTSTSNTSQNINDTEQPQQQPQPNDSETNIYTHATALIFVIDAQDEPYDHVLQSFTETVTRAISANPHVAIEVFINKVDGELFFGEEAKYDCKRDIMQQVSEELQDAGIQEEHVPISYHLTSIYDHSVFEAFSRVVQKLIPQLPTLENLLNVLVSTCSMEKAYLFDVASKLYISTDSSPVDMQSVELCSDMIDVVLDVSGIYGLRNQQQQQQQEEKERNKSSDDLNQMNSIKSITDGTNASYEGNCVNNNENGKSTTTTTTITSTTNTDDDQVNGRNMIGTGLEVITTTTQSTNTVNNNNLISPNSTGEEISSQGDQDHNNLDLVVAQNNSSYEENEAEDETEMVTDSAYDSESSSVIRLSNGMILYLKEVDTMLALVCITRAENFRKKSLINYNISCLKKALRMLVQKQQSPTAITSSFNEMQKEEEEEEEENREEVVAGLLGNESSLQHY